MSATARVVSTQILCPSRAACLALLGKASSGAGNVDAPHTCAFVDDFGRAMVELGRRDQALGRAWHVPNAGTISPRKVVDLLFQPRGKLPMMSVFSRPMMALAGFFIPGAREPVEIRVESEKPFGIDRSLPKKSCGLRATTPPEAIRVMPD